MMTAIQRSAACVPEAVVVRLGVAPQVIFRGAHLRVPGRLAIAEIRSGTGALLTAGTAITALCLALLASDHVTLVTWTLG